MNPPSQLSSIVVLYHGFCTDGFGSAYAAWKKFGDTASYSPMERGKDAIPPEALRDKEVYVLDYSFSKEIMEAYQAAAKSFTVIDHHVSSKEDVESLSSFVFDNNRSGAYLSWQYFHPTTDVPKLIQYISDSDIWAHALPDWEEIESFIYSNGESHFTFSHFEKLHTMLETESGYLQAKEVGALLLGAHKASVASYIPKAELISFEGYEIYAVNAPREVRSELGNILAQKTNTFSLLFAYEHGAWKCSLRSVKDFDVSSIAAKFGGGGHKNAAAFILQTAFPLQITHSMESLQMIH